MPAASGVEDQGPGIPEDKLTAIFDRFYTERPAGEKFGTHSGLGLSISKQIVEAHRGRIWAENLIDPRDKGTVRGARFLIALAGVSRERGASIFFVAPMVRIMSGRLCDSLEKRLAHTKLVHLAD